jgi:hypothetical protein
MHTQRANAREIVQYQLIQISTLREVQGSWRNEGDTAATIAIRTMKATEEPMNLKEFHEVEGSDAARNALIVRNRQCVESFPPAPLAKYLEGRQQMTF